MGKVMIFEKLGVFINDQRVGDATNVVVRFNAQNVMPMDTNSMEHDSRADEPRDQDLADVIIGWLNEIVATDPMAVVQLLQYRVPCNHSLANHRTVQVCADDGAITVGMLGIINGLIGTIPTGPKKGWGYVSTEFADDGSIIRFVRTDRALENP